MTSFSYNAAAAITESPALPAGLVMLVGQMRNLNGAGLYTIGSATGFLCAHNATYTQNILKSKITLGQDAGPDDLLQIIFGVRTGANANCIVGVHIQGTSVQFKSETAAEVMTPRGTATLATTLVATDQVEVWYYKTTGAILLYINGINIPAVGASPDLLYAAEASLSPAFGEYTPDLGYAKIAQLDFNEAADGIAGSGATTESGPDTVSGSGLVPTFGSGATTEAGPGTASGSGTVASPTSTDVSALTIKSPLVGNEFLAIGDGGVAKSATPAGILALIYAGSGTVAALASVSKAAFRIAYATDGRRSGQGLGAGTGCPVWADGTNWRTFYDNSIVAA